MVFTLKNLHIPASEPFASLEKLSFLHKSNFQFLNEPSESHSFFAVPVNSTQ